MRNAKKLDIARRIQGAGYLRECILCLPTLEIENNPFHSFVFDYFGGMGVILELRIASKNRMMLIQDFGDLKLGGKMCEVDWLENGEWDVYEFTRGPTYPRCGVLNHRTGARGVVKPGQPLEGVLLGRSVIPFSPRYLHGLRLAMEFAILDGFDTWHPADLIVQVDDHLCPKIRPSRRGSLFEAAKVSESERENIAGDLVNNVQDHQKDTRVPIPQTTRPASRSSEKQQ
jgi:hypothetical protein